MSNELAPLSLRAVQPGDAAALGVFFTALAANGDTAFFEPHPLTADHAKEIARYSGRDLYVIAEAGGDILGYGLLRGWDAGYEIPSLGIAIHPASRGIQLGRLMMHYLHTLARRRGAPRVRLRVHGANQQAAALYRSLGYEFDARQGEYLVAFLTLAPPRA